jgi:hypothetical protein
MKYALRLLPILSVAALLLTGASLRSDAAGRTIFDGLWSVEIVTQHGDCDRSLRYSLRIVGGRVQADDTRYQVDGAVAPSGAVRVIVAEAGRSASGVGHLTRDSGRGQWRTSTGECGGHWTAARRVANE